MKIKIIGLIIFWIFAAYMVGMSFVASWWVVPTFRNLSPAQVSATVWAPNSLLFWVWGLSIPVGSVLAGVGLLLYVQSRSSRIWLFGIGLILILTLIGVLDMPAYYPSVFGVGGGLILALFLITLWFWAKKRPLLEGSAKTAADFQLVSYVFFLVAAWYLCGLLGAPAYLLDPDKMLQFQSLSGAQNYAVEILTYFVFGWLFAFLSQYKARQVQS